MNKSGTFFDFKERFNNEDVCRKHLFNVRWPNGFECPKCSNGSYYLIKKRNTFQCTACRYQASVTAGTVMDKTRVTLEKWFWAIFKFVTDKRGYSATALHIDLGVGYKTAWYMLQRLRTAMFEHECEQTLSGLVEVDEVYFGGSDDETEDETVKRGRGTDKIKAFVAVSITDEGKPNEIKIETAEALDTDAAVAFAKYNVEKGSVIATDKYPIYNSLTANGYEHQAKAFEPKVDKKHLKWLHTIISNAKALFVGTYHGLDKKHFQFYLSEFCFRFNHRKNKNSLINQLLVGCILTEKISYAELTR